VDADDADDTAPLSQSVWNLIDPPRPSGSKAAGIPPPSGSKAPGTPPLEETPEPKARPIVPPLRPKPKALLRVGGTPLAKSEAKAKAKAKSEKAAAEPRPRAKWPEGSFKGAAKACYVLRL